MKRLFFDSLRRRLILSLFMVSGGAFLVSPLRSEPVYNIPTTALVPLRSTQIPHLDRFKRTPEGVWKKTREDLSGTLPVYVFEEGAARLDVNAFSGDVEQLMYGQEPPHGAKNLSEALLRERSLQVLKRFYPDPVRLTEAVSVPGETYLADGTLQKSWSFRYQQSASFNPRATNLCNLELLQATGELARYSHRFRKGDIPPPTLTQARAVSIARWEFIQRNKGEMKVQLLVPSEFTGEQKAAWQLKIGAPDAEYSFEEDAWFHQRALWKINFNFGEVYLDDETGQVQNITALPIPLQETNWQVFALTAPVKGVKPEGLPGPLAPVETVDTAFNGETIRAGDPYIGLHYPPIVRDQSPLIFSQYFPKFLIDVTRKGNSITLHGKLKEKGKEATLTLGQGKAIVDGKEVTFASPPVEVDGRLYLPAELLQSCNGIPIRWEPKKKMLWVETRFLRRDGDETAAFINEP